MSRSILGATAALLCVAPAVHAQTTDSAATPAPAVVVETPAPPAPANAGGSPIAATRPEFVATPVAIAAQKVEAPSTGMAVLPANTEVMLRLDEEVNSRLMRVGDKFRLSVLQDVMIGNYVVIPRGTPASGSVSWRTGKGAFGKSAKMEITMDSINLRGRPIAVTGNFRQEGEGNTGATVGVAVAAGVFAAFVTGRSAIFQNGREFRVATREALPVSLPQ